MSKDILGDDRVAAVLTAAVSVINPMLDVLAESDPLGIKERTHRRADPQDSVAARARDAVTDRAVDIMASVFDAAETPGTRAWEQLSVDDRVSWWVKRVGGITTIAVAFPGMFGALARRLPVGDLLGFANQAIVLVAVARVYGVTERDDHVRLLAAVLCNRQLSPRTAEVAVENALDAGTSDEVARRTPRSPFWVLSTLWSVTKILRAVTDELVKRPRSRSVYRWLGNLPVVGAIAGYFGERDALSRAAKLGRRWIEGQGLARTSLPRRTTFVNVRKG